MEPQMIPNSQRILKKEEQIESESVSHSVLSDPLWPPQTTDHQAPLSIGFPRQEY